MFGLFKRTRIEPWERDFLKEVFIKLPGDNQEYISQIDSGLFKRVLVGISDIPNYIAFTYEPSLYKKFYKAKNRNHKLTNIKVKDEISRNYLSISIYISDGVINGYSVDTNNKVKKYKFDVSEINISHAKKIYFDNEDSKIILPLLSLDERSNINENDIFVVPINGKDYYHLKELEDGDFIGINKDNMIYRITHDPYMVQELKRNTLTSFLKQD